MTQSSRSRQASLTVAYELAVDKVCNDFEDAWKSGRQPQIEEYLCKVPEAARDSLLRELIVIDLHYQTVRPDLQNEYLRRFPELDAAWLAGVGDAPIEVETTSIKQAVGSRQLDKAIAIGTRVGDYEIIEKLGQGGMGVVLRARDPLFNRTLAVKVLKTTPQAHPSLAQRFQEESQIMGQLQHPGIPPVHDRGELADGRPFFSMKLIEGRTLSDLLGARRDPLEDLGRFLGIFEQVCQTLAYVHSRGILHRDLKPSNIMVGAFAEVQVMDWGLAKIVRGSSSVVRGLETTESQRARISSRIPRTTDQEPRTKTGDVMGTPAYMAPEQARGEIHSLDQRADVFGLGAILCEILTGEPAFRRLVDKNPMSQAAHEDLSDAFERLNACGADAELIALARRCLAPAKEKRPQHARQVAEAIEKFQLEVQEQLRRAEMEKAQVQVQAAEERKRRRIVLALGTALVLLVIGAAGAGLWYQQDRITRAAETQRKRELAEQRIGQALGEATKVRTELHAQLDKKGGVFLLLNQPAEWRRRLEAALAKLTRAKELQIVAEGRIALQLQKQVQSLLAELDKDDADRQLALDLEQVRRDRSTMEINKFNDALALKNYAQVFQRAGLDAGKEDPRIVVRRIKQSPVREQQVAALKDWAYLAWLANDNKLQGRLLEIARLADPDPWQAEISDPNLWADSEKLKEKTQHLLQDRNVMAKLSPQTLLLLAMLLPIERGQREPWLRRAQILYPTDFWLAYELGYVLHKDKPSEAAGLFRTAVAVRPDSTAAWSGLGLSLYNQQKLEDAVIAYRKALDIDPDHSLAWCNLGHVLRDQKKLAKAEEAYGQALTLDRQYVNAWIGLGNALSDRKQMEDAVEAYKKATSLAPTNALAWRNLGKTYAAQRKPADATTAYRHAVKIIPRDYKTWNDLGIQQARQKEWTDAETSFRTAIKIDPQYALAWNNLGAVLRNQQQTEEAIAAYRRAISIDPEYAQAWCNLGRALFGQEKLREAVTAFERALKIDPEYAKAWYNLGRAFQAMMKFEQALESYERSLAISKDQPNPYNNIAWILVAGPKELRDANRALPLARRAVQLGNNAPEYLDTLGIVYYRMGKYEHAANHLGNAAAIWKGKGYASNLFFLAMTFCKMGELTKAKQYYDRALSFEKSKSNLSKAQQIELEAIRREAAALLKQ